MKMQENPLHSVWESLRAQAKVISEGEPLLRNAVKRKLLDRATLSEALCAVLSEELAGATISQSDLFDLFARTAAEHAELAQSAALDILSVLRDDPAAKKHITPFLFFKGFHALQAYRLAHIFWREGRQDLALYLQGRISAVLHVDIHPAARIGHGVTLDHASGLVIGETSIIGNNVMILHGVTLGTKGFDQGERHPIIEDDVTIGANATLIGRIRIGKGATVAAGSVVIESVAPGHTVAGVPARIVKTP